MKISAFVESFMEEAPENLHIIAFSENAILAMDQETGKALYSYQIVGIEDYSFECTLLSEISASVLPWFNDMIRDLNLTVETIETETDYFEKITLN